MGEGVRGHAERWLHGDASGPGAALLGAVLLPAEAAYRGAVAVRGFAYDHGLLPARRAPIPVLSVGNIAVGGAGKTPVSAWLVERLLERGHRPALLHGGYGEDEPALHRRWHPGVPVVALRDRLEGSRRAASAGADVAVLDDGFQHRALRRDLDLVLVAAEDWTPKPRLLPRGAWREPPTALRRADLIAVTRKTADPERAESVASALARLSGRPVLRLALRPAGWLDRPGAQEPGRCIAVAGIAHPDRFVQNARQAGAAVTTALTFPDHHRYSAGDAARILEAAAGLPVVTTEKDAVKMAGLATGLDPWVLRQTVVVEHGMDALDAALDEVVP